MGDEHRRVAGVEHAAAVVGQARRAGIFDASCDHRAAWPSATAQAVYRPRCRDAITSSTAVGGACARNRRSDSTCSQAADPSGVNTRSSHPRTAAAAPAPASAPPTPASTSGRSVCRVERYPPSSARATPTTPVARRGPGPTGPGGRRRHPTDRSALPGGELPPRASHIRAKSWSYAPSVSRSRPAKAMSSSRATAGSPGWSRTMVISLAGVSTGMRSMTPPPPGRSATRPCADRGPGRRSAPRPRPATARRAATATERHAGPAPPGRSAPCRPARVTGTPTLGTNSRPARRITCEATATTSRATTGEDPRHERVDAPRRGSRGGRRRQRRSARERSAGGRGHRHPLAGAQPGDARDEMAGLDHPIRTRHVSPAAPSCMRLGSALSEPSRAPRRGQPAPARWCPPHSRPADRRAPPRPRCRSGRSDAARGPCAAGRRCGSAHCRPC